MFTYIFIYYYKSMDLYIFIYIQIYSTIHIY